MPWEDNDFGVYANGSRIFSVWGDIWDFPLFIYPFADGQRFLCIDDDDTATLVFVVDSRAASTNQLDLPQWPPDDYTREYLKQRATNVVIAPKGLVRLPTYAEVQEVSSNLGKLTPSQFKATSFPCANFGIWRFYVPRDYLLRDLSTNRHSVW